MRVKAARSVWDVALDCLSRRSLTNYELECRLQEKGFDSSDIERVLKRLSDLGYLNDQELALMYSKSRLKRYSKRRVLYDLKNRGLAAQVIEQAIAESYCSADEFQQCLSLAKQWWEQESKRWEQKNLVQTSPVPREQWLQQKIARRLMQRGYPSDMLWPALNEVRIDNH